MIRLNGSCTIPLALWDSEPPDHKISSILVTQDTRYLVTGDHEGKLITWSLTKSKIEPLLCLVGHRGKITAICISVGSNDKKPYFVSATDTGEIALWDLEEGRCIEFRIDWRYVHTDIQSHQPLYQEPTMLLACGHYPELVLLHSTSLTRLVSLVSRSHVDWIRAFTVFSHPKSKEDVVVGLSMQGIVIVWTLNGSEIHDSIKQEEESKPLRCNHILRLLCNPFSPRVILIVTSFSAQVYDGIDWCILCSLDSPHGEAFTNGLFLKSNYILLSTTSERYLVYRLPNESTPGHPLFRKNVQNAPPPVMVSILTGPQVESGMPPSMETSLNLLEFPSSKDVNILHANDRGQIGMWILGEKCFLATDSTVKSVFKFDLSYSTCLRSIWNDSSLLNLSTCVQNLISSLSLSGESTPIPMTNLNESSGLFNGEKSLPIENFSSSTKSVRVTTLTLLHKENRIAVGLQSGDILIVDSLDVLLNVIFSRNHQANPGTVQRLCGHKAPVTCLLHPASSPPRYSGISTDLNSTSQTKSECNSNAQPPLGGFPYFTDSFGNANQSSNPFSSIYSNEANRCLISGSEDFTVKLWDLVSGTCVLSLVLHSAPVIALVLSPVTQSTVTKIIDSVCSVAADHSVALFNPWRREVFLISGHHASPVTSLGWHPDQGFLMVSYQDESLLIWEIATGLLDRNEGGHTAIEILSNCPHVTRIRTPQGQPVHMTLKRSRGPSRSRPCSLLAAQSMESCRQSGAYILYFDIEALIMSLLSTERTNHLTQFTLGEDEEQSRASTKPLFKNNVSARRTQPVNGQSLNDSARENKELPNSLSINQTNQILLQILASFLHPWKLNRNLDESCFNSLGWLEPLSDLCFGTLSRYNCLALQMPRVTASLNESALSRWCVSSCMSTQFMLAAMSLQQTVTCLTDKLFCDWTPLNSLITNYTGAGGGTKRIVGGNNPILHNDSIYHDQESSIRQIWLMAATILCTDLQDLLSTNPSKYKRPFFQLLAQCWQDRCLQIREAAQTLLHCALDRLGDDGRKCIVEDWSGHLPAPGQILQEDQSGGSLLLETDWWIKTPGFWITESQRHSLQCTSVIMMGVIGARYGHIVSNESQPKNSGHSTGSSKPQDGFGLDNYYLARCTSRALTALVMQSKNPSANMKTSASANQIGRDSPEFISASSTNVDPYSSLHRSALDLIGRGFAVWEPYLEVGPLLTKILEISAGSTKLLASLKQSSHTICNLDTCEPLTPNIDTGRTARQALCLIASARPKAYIVTLSREVLRYSGQNSSQPSNQQNAATNNPPGGGPVNTPADASSVITGGSSHINSSTNPLTECPLIAASLEVIQSLQLICAKKSSAELNDVIGEVVDILLICLDKKKLCEAGLTELFPSIKRFPSVASNTQAQKVVVGNMNGIVSFYDYKIGKYQTIQAHRGPISSVSLSNDGKYAASYCVSDNLVKTWQPCSTGFFGMGTPQARLLASHTVPPISHTSHSASSPNLPPLSHNHSHFLQWMEPRILHIMSMDGQLVSKIKI